MMAWERRGKGERERVGSCFEWECGIDGDD